MKKRKLRERLLSYILCLAMVIALVPMNALTVRAEGVEHPCQHCGGTGKVCGKHNIVHRELSYENEPECGKPCVIIIEDHEDYCETHANWGGVQCEYCKGTGSDPNWTHDHHFVYVHKVDFSGENFHIAKCDYPGCDEGGSAPGYGQNCNTYGPDGACSYCGFKAEGATHTHFQDTHHEPVAATCATPGMVEYWDCLCGEKLDADGNVLSSTEVAATGNHDFVDQGDGTHKCSVCDVSESHNFIDGVCVCIYIDPKSGATFRDGFKCPCDETCDLCNDGYHDECEKESGKTHFTSVATLSWVELQKSENGEKYNYSADKIYNTSIGDYAFSNCSNLTGIIIPESVTSIGDYAFYNCSNLTSITIPESVTSIGDWSFDNCSNLTSITIPESVTSIGDGAFFGCKKITSIVIPKNVTSIGDWSFDDCSNLTSITIPESVTSIGDCLFYNCSNLTSITIPESVTSIGDDAFSYCRNLTSITIPKGVKSIGNGIFGGCEGLKELKVDENNTTYTSRVTSGKECNAIIDRATNTLVIGIGSTVILPGITTIGSRSFADCSNLTSITIPESVTSIGNEAFYSCGKLASITIPESVTSIGDYAFQWCEGLQEITIKNPAVLLGEKPFSACTSLDTIILSCMNENVAEGKDSYWTDKDVYDYQSKIKIIHNSVPENDEKHKCADCGSQEVHDFSNDCDNICEICGYERVATVIHDFSEQPYEAIEDGKHHQKCKYCDNYSEAEEHSLVDGVCLKCGVISLKLCKDISIDAKNVLFNNTAQVPEVTVAYKGTVLNKGTDYTLVVDRKTAIGTYELTVEGIGKYRDKVKERWSILPTSGLYCEVIPNQVYTGKVIKPEVKVYSDGMLLTLGKDYTVSYGKYNTNVATKDAMSNGKSVAPSVTITGKGNYSDKKVVTFSIVQCQIDTADVQDIVVAKSKSAIKISPVVTLAGKKLKPGTDYVISTSTSLKDEVISYKDVGEYSLWVVGKNNYAGAVPFKFIITEKTLAGKVTVKKIPDQKYNAGDEVRPELEVTYKIGGKVTNVTDNFTVKYVNNTEIGTATAIITAKPESTLFAGSKTVTFKITGEQIKNAKLGADGRGTIPSKIYDGNPYEPVLNLYVGATPLIRDVDYTVTYSKNVNVGTATAKVTGIGKYTGTKNFSYKITQYSAADDAGKVITIDDGAAIIVAYEKGGVTPKTVIKMNGVILQEKKDYTLSYANNKGVAKADATNPSGKSIAPKITVTFKGNLSGRKTVNFEIKNKDIGAGRITIADKEVSGKPNAWKQTAVTIVDTNGKKLVAGTDYNKTFKYYSDPECTREITADTLGANTTVYVKVDGIKNYDKSIVGCYRISEKNISKVSASIEPQTFTGSAICPSVSDIKVWTGSGNNKTELKAGVDYDIVPGSYTNNVNKGIATVTIVGKGDYYGTKVVKYTIGVKKFLWWE